MFDLDLDDLDAKATLAAAARLHDERCRVDVEMIECALHFADLHPDPAVVPGHVPAPPGGERGKVYGGQGCPGVAEFAPAEFGAAVGRSKVSAALFIGQALALRHRLPLTWAQVRAGHGEAWKALQVAKASMGLSEEGAAIVDERVAHLFDGLTPLRLANIVKAALWQVDPDGARAEAEQKARERGVWPGRTDEHGTTMLFVKAATGDVIRFGATVRQVADALAALGDTGSLNSRRAKAIGVLADPAYAHELLQVAQHLTTPSEPATDPGTDSATEPADAAPAATSVSGLGPAPATTSVPEPEPRPARVPATEPAPDPAATSISKSEPEFARVHEPEPAPDPAAASVPKSEPEFARVHEPEPESERVPEPARIPESERVPGPARVAEPGNATVAGLVGASTVVEPWDFPADPDADAEVGHDSTHPSCPDPDPGREANSGDGDAPARPGEPRPGMDPAARRELDAKLAAIKQAAYRDGIGSTGRGPARTVLYAHLTDATLLAGEGVARIEGFGPALVASLGELLGHDQVVVQPVIDLKDNVSVDAYEIPHRIRERVKLTHPVELFPYGSAETGINTDLDHIKPYRKDGPPGQTSTRTLAPLGRLSHRIKTHGGWTATRLDDDTMEWVTRHGFKFHVTHRGTHRIRQPDEFGDSWRP